MKNSGSGRGEGAPEMPGERVLIVEDDEALGELLVEEVSERGYEVRGAATAEEAQELLRRWEPDLVISDLRLPGADGRALLEFALSLHVRPAFVVITAFGTVAQAVECLKRGADDFLVKPLDLDHLMVSVERVLEARRLRDEVQRYKELLGSDSFGGIIGRSRPMRELFDQIRQVARAQGPVLVVGESGVGKEMVARALHLESNRQHKAFIPVNAAGIPGELIESELFGHAAGAFTGASRRRTGLFEEARGGTLFLDEISEMPAALQAKLLRILQDGMVRPVGSNREQSIDVRIIAATNRDLERLVGEGGFREDLYFRLEAFTLRVPPLRERAEDIELLAAFFLRRYAREMERDVRGISAAALRRLKEYAYPGNVRELQNAIQRATAFCPGRTIQLEHLPARMREGSNGGSARPAARLGLEGLLGDAALPPLHEIEQRYIAHVLEQVGGNKRQAARLLGISRRTLYRRLDERNPTSDRQG